MSRKYIALAALAIVVTAISLTFAFANLAAKTKAPDFTLPTVAGKTFTLSNSFQPTPHVVVLDIWATWCPPCRAEIPHLIALANKFKTQDVSIVGVALDQDKTSVSSFVNQQKVNYTVALDPGANKLGNLYKVGGIPATYVIDKKGIIRYTHSGFPTGDKEAQRSEAAALEREVNTLLGEK